MKASRESGEQRPTSPHELYRDAWGAAVPGVGEREEAAGG